MAEIVLAAETGRPRGSSAARRLRASGRIPAVVYGAGIESTPVSVDWRELRAALTTERGLNALINLELDGSQHTVVVREMQRHPVRRDVLHVDFLAVDVTQDISGDVPLIVVGEAEKVVRERGVVEQVLSVLVVRGRPGAIPGQIEVDVSDLDVGGQITVGDLDLPEGVETDTDPEETVVTAVLSSAAFVEEEAEEAAEPAEAPAEGEAAEGAE